MSRTPIPTHRLEEQSQLAQSLISHALRNGQPYRSVYRAGKDAEELMRDEDRRMAMIAVLESEATRALALADMLRAIETVTP